MTALAGGQQYVQEPGWVKAYINIQAYRTFNNSHTNSLGIEEYLAFKKFPHRISLDDILY